MPQKDTLPNTGSETASGTNNNLYEGPFEKSVSNDTMANGMGIAQAPQLKSFENIPGVNQSEQNKLKEREIARFNDLSGSGAMSMTVPITNAGIVLGSFGGAFGEGGSKPDIQGGANK